MHERLKPVINEGNKFNVHASVVEDPHGSIAEKNKFYPYRLELT